MTEIAVDLFKDAGWQRRYREAVADHWGIVEAMHNGILEKAVNMLGPARHLGKIERSKEELADMVYLPDGSHVIVRTKMERKLHAVIFTTGMLFDIKGEKGQLPFRQMKDNAAQHVVPLPASDEELDGHYNTPLESGEGH